MVRSGVWMGSWLALVVASGCAQYGAYREAAADDGWAWEPQAVEAAAIPGLEPQSRSVVNFGLTVPSSQSDTEVTYPPTATPADTAATTEESEEAPKRLKVYTARFQLLVPNVEDAVDRFLKRVDELGGYLETRRNAQVTVRVPAARFVEVTQELRGYGLVTDETMQALDVTKQFYDLKIRIENAELSRTRLLALLEKAQEVDDALRIESELRRLTEEIDRLKGELRFLSERIAFSTIEVQFSSTAPPPRAMPRRTRSRFDWINQVGVEHVIQEF